MDDVKRLMDEAERGGLKASQGLLRVVLEMWNRAKADVRSAQAAARRLRRVVVLLSVLVGICLALCVGMGVEAHRQNTEIAEIRLILEDGQNEQPAH